MVWACQPGAGGDPTGPWKAVSLAAERQKTPTIGLHSPRLRPGSCRFLPFLAATPPQPVPSLPRALLLAAGRPQVPVLLSCSQRRPPARLPHSTLVSAEQLRGQRVTISLWAVNAGRVSLSLHSLSRSCQSHPLPRAPPRPLWPRAPVQSPPHPHPHPGPAPCWSLCFHPAPSYLSPGGSLSCSPASCPAERKGRATPSG